MNLGIKFRNWITLCVVFPSVVLLITVNAALFYGLKSSQQTALNETNTQLYSELEGVLSAERVRLRSIAGLPITQSLLTSVERNKGRLSLVRRSDENKKVEDVWNTFDRNDLKVRNVLDNSVGDLFGHLSASANRKTRLILTDAAGALLAASERTPHYDYSDEEWWIETREAQTERILAGGINPDGSINLSVAVWGDYATKVLLGIMYDVINLQDFDLQRDRASRSQEKVASILVGARHNWFIGGDDATAAYADETLQSRFRETSALEGWMSGFRFVAQPLDSDLIWMEQVWLVTVRPESRFPASLYVPILLSILGSVVIVFSLMFVSMRAGHTMFFAPLRDLVEAGYWTLTRVNQARVKQGRVIPLPQNFDLGKAESSEPSQIGRDLEEWISGYKQQLQDASYAQNYEMKKDLEMARDFQMAYLNRPYPKVPVNHVEGRIRLAFSHRYEPALALGGDFFDIIHLADDCAGIFIADVMGHGTRSALITAILRTLLSDLVQQGRNAPYYIDEINKQFCELIASVPSPQFASCFYFVADTTSRVATFTTAGHPAPFLLRRSVGRISQLEVPEPRGAALGLIPDEAFTGGHARLQDGDLFVFFTDGFVEAVNAAGEEFGMKRFEKTLKNNLYKSLEELMDILEQAVKSFVGEEPFADDVCVVGVEVTTKAEA